MRARTPAYLAALVAAVLCSLPSGAAAGPAAPTRPVMPVTPVAPVQVTPMPYGGDGLARISPELAGVRVDGAAARNAQSSYESTSSELAAATAARVNAEAELVALAQRDVELTASIVAHTQARKAAAIELAGARATLREVAVGTYILSADNDNITRALDLQHTLELGSTQVMSSTVREAVTERAAAAEATVLAESAAVDTAHDERQATRVRTVEVAQARERAAVDQVRLTADVGTRLFELEQARATSRVTGLDFTLVAFDAFYRAAAARADSCAVPWWGLAGISRVEGRHGTYGGGSLRPDGQVTRTIIGIPLSGAAGTAIVGDSDGGALDGDAQFDRAVGPMQFIPSTWARFGTDGDLDGDVDPQNMYDAVASAADYLCYGRVMRTEGDLRAGYFSYNHSEAYVETVFGYAISYAGFRLPPPPPPPPVPPAYPVQA